MYRVLRAWFRVSFLSFFFSNRGIKRKRMTFEFLPSFQVNSHESIYFHSSFLFFAFKHRFSQDGILWQLYDVFYHYFTLFPLINTRYHKPEGETTQWEDILAEKHIIPRRQVLSRCSMSWSSPLGHWKGIWRSDGRSQAAGRGQSLRGKGLGWTQRYRCISLSLLQDS